MDTVIFHISVSDPSLLPTGDLSGLLQALSDFQSVLEADAEVMRDWERMNFANEGGTFGQPWAPNKPSTIARKLREGYGSRTMIRTGAMQAGAGQSSSYQDGTVTTGFDLGETPYAPYQQAETKNKPGRIVIALVAGEIAEMETKLQQYLDAAVGGSAQSMGLTITAEVV
jgi:hypothetical protein